MRPLVVATLTMLGRTLVQIMLWGVLFLGLGEFEQAYDAIYHSAVNFSSLDLRRRKADIGVPPAGR